MQGYHLYEVGIEDSVTTLVQKLRNTVESLVFFRISSDADFLFTDDNLKLLAHYAEEENKDLILLTRSIRVKEKAEKVRLLTADSVEAFLGVQKKEVDPSVLDKTSRAPISSWAKKTVIFASIAFLVFLLLQWGLRYWLLPKVTVTVYPKVLTTDTELSIDLQSLAQKNESVVLTKVYTEAATGTQIVGIERAVGEIVFFNQNTKELKLYKGTELRSKDGKVYLLKEDILVPGAEAVYVLDVRSSLTAGQALGFIEAKELGSEYNVKAGDISVIKGNYNDLTVRNVKAITGGKSETRAVVTKADLQRATDRLLSLLKEETLPEKNAEHILNDSIVRKDPLINFDKEIGDFATTVTATGSQEIIYRTITNVEIERKAEEVIHKRLPDDYNLLPKTTRVSQVVFRDKEALIKASFDLYPTLNTDELIQSIAGKTLHDAIASLDANCKVVIDGLKGELLPTKKEWIKVVISDQLEPERTLVALKLLSDS